MVIRIPTVRAVVAFSPTTLSDVLSSPESFANLDLVVTTSTQVFKVSYAVVGLYWVCFCLLLRCTVLQASRFALRTLTLIWRQVARRLGPWSLDMAVSMMMLLCQSARQSAT